MPVGPDGGLIQALALDPGQPAVMYCASYTYPRNPLSFRSTDAGGSWQAGGSFELPDVSGMVVDPHRAGNVYACGRGSRLWRSTDVGLRWSGIDLPGQASELAADPFAAGRLYASGSVEADLKQPAVFVSTDYGSSWTPTVLDTVEGHAASFQADRDIPGLLFAGCDRGRLFRSTDGGATWHTRNAGLPGEEVVLSLALGPAVGLAGTNAGVFRTTDLGGLWQPVSGPQRVSDLEFGAAGVAYARGRDSAERVFVSTDYGASWAPTALDSAMVASSRLVLHLRQSDTVFLNVAGGVLKTTDRGASWRFANRGLRFATVYTVGVDPRDDRSVYVAAHDCRVFRTTDLGETWSRCSGFWCIENGMCCGFGFAAADTVELVYAFEGSG